MTADSTGTSDSPLIVALRHEIVEAQKSQAEFLKWKLIAAATVAAGGLGLALPANCAAPRARLLICLVPLICAYVDLLSLHIVVRIIVIASFLRRCDDPYELFVHRIRTVKANPFQFELMALHGSSIAFNSLIALFGVYGLVGGWDRVDAVSFMASGTGGVLVSLLLWRVFISRVRQVVQFTGPGTI